VMVLKTLETMGPLHGYGMPPNSEQNQWRSAVRQLRNFVPVASQAGARGIHRFRVGRLRQPIVKQNITNSPEQDGNQLQRETRDWEQGNHDPRALLVTGRKSS